MLAIEKNITSTSELCHARRFNGNLRAFAKWAGNISPNRRYLEKSILNRSIKVPEDMMLVVEPVGDSSTGIKIMRQEQFHIEYQLAKVTFNREAYFLKAGAPIAINHATPSGANAKDYRKLKYDLLVDNWLSIPDTLKVLVEPIMGHEWCAKNAVDFFLIKKYDKVIAYESRANLIKLDRTESQSLSWYKLDFNDFNMAFIEARQEIQS